MAAVSCGPSQMSPSMKSKSGHPSKWATFRRRLAERGFAEAELAQVTCPIGLPGIRGKQPAVVALAVMAQLLQRGAP